MPILYETKAMSTRIRRFLFPQIFFCGCENFRVHTQRIRIVFSKCHPPFVAVSLFTNLFLATRETVFRITINVALKGHEDLSV